MAPVQAVKDSTPFDATSSYKVCLLMPAWTTTSVQMLIDSARYDNALSTGLVGFSAQQAGSAGVWCCMTDPQGTCRPTTQRMRCRSAREAQACSMCPTTCPSMAPPPTR